MSDTDLLRRGGLGMAAVVLSVLLSIALGLPVPVTVLLVGLAVAVVVVVELLRRRPEPVLRPALVPPAPATATCPVRGTLPSDTAGYSFGFSGTMIWQPLPGPRGPRHADLAVFGEEMLVARAAQVTRTCTPMDPDSARRRVAALLGTPHDDEHGRVRAWAADVSVKVDEKDAERLREVVDLHKDEALWEHRRGHERNLRKYLGEEALATTGSAVVWWLARHLDDDDIGQAVSLVEHLHRLSRVARGDLDDLPADHFLVRLSDTLDRPDAYGPDADSPVSAACPSAAGLVGELFPYDSDERRLFVQELGRLLEGAGRVEQERDLRAAFGVPRADDRVEDELHPEDERLRDDEWPPEDELR